MRVFFEKDVLYKEELFEDLDDLLSTSFEREHYIEFEDTFENVKSTEWHKKLRTIRIERLEKFLSRNSYLTKERKKVIPTIYVAIVDEKDKYRFAPKASNIKLRNSFKIMIENKDSDGNFLNFCIKVYGDKLQRLKFMQEKEYCEYFHVGGKSSFKKNIETLLKTHLPFQLYVIKDSDKAHPNHNFEENNDLEKFCKELSIKLWITEKREIENYLPESLLKSYIEKIKNIKQNTNLSKKDQKKIKDIDNIEKLLNEFCKFSFEQKNHFDMKSGLKPEVIKEIKSKNNKNKSKNNSNFRNEADSLENLLNQEVANLYKEIVNIEILQRGFGDDLDELFREAKFDDNLIKEFELNVKNEILDKLEVISGLL